MLKGFPIDFIRQTFEQKMLEQHIINPFFFGGKDQVSIHSFYEQLSSQDEVDRFVETYRDLADQQNRTGIILNGTLVSPENPSITNLYSSLIVPMTFTCSLRCLLANRDQGIITINNLINELKGRKVDIAQLDCVDENGNKYSTPFMVETIGENDGKSKLKNGDYFETLPTADSVEDLYDMGVDIDYSELEYIYCKHNNQLKVCKVGGASTSLPYMSFDPNTATLVDNKTITIDGGASFNVSIPRVYNATGVLTIHDTDYELDVTLNVTGKLISSVYDSGTNTSTMVAKFVLDKNIQEYVENYDSFELTNVHLHSVEFSILDNDGEHQSIIFPPEHTSFEKYKVSFSFDAIRCDEPRNLNGEEYCELSFGGSATLVNNGVKLGNDLLKISVSKYKIPASTDITFSDNITYLEPLEMPSGNNINTNPNQLVSNLFKTNAHADAIALTLQYTFIIDESVDILNQWFNYARYGTLGTSQNQVSPNLIYKVHEYYCSWGEYKDIEMLTKIVENIDIENTESDTLTISLTMQIQGENN